MSGRTHARGRPLVRNSCLALGLATGYYSCESSERMDTLATIRRAKITPPRHALILRPYVARDRASVVGLLADLPALYPGADEWLERRLTQVVRGQAQCTLVWVGARCVGLTIETPKGGQRLKLSTLYVDPDFRRLGIGISLVRHCWNGWLAQGIQSVHVTVRDGREAALYALLHRFGFSFRTLVMDRYGSGQHEHILCSSLLDRASNELFRDPG